MSKLTEIWAKIRRKWMKLRLQPIRVFCLHHVCKTYDGITMYQGDWVQIDDFKQKVQRMQQDRVEFISLTDAYNKITNDKFRNRKYAVLTFDDGYDSLKEILPWLEQIVQSNRSLLIIADDLENEVVSTLALNKLRGTFNVVATKAPGFGDNQKAQLEDIAILTGATFYSKDLDMDLKDMKLSDLGTVKRLIVKKDSTTMIGGAGDKAKVADRVKEIEAQIENTKSEYDKKRMSERLGKLSNGVAVIKVGAATETELKEKKLRIEDALNSTRAAVSEGIVVGGGACLVNAYVALKDKVHSDVVDVQKGVKLVFDALLAPLAQIADNAGFNSEDIVEKQKTEEPGIGFDAKAGQWVNMFDAGIIDPAKVTRNALINSTSISALFITTEAGVAKIPEPEQPAPQAPGMY